MLTNEQIKSNLLNYRIENGVVIDKLNNQPVQDEDKILEVKTSIMMYKEAQDLYVKRLRGAPEDQDFYINKALKIYGLDGEVNTYPQNKIIREILEGNGSLQVDYPGNNLSESEKFSFLCEPKKEYGLATLKYIAHQKGIDISNIKVSIDTSEFQHIGNSKVSINYDKKPYQKKEHVSKDETQKQPLYSHPRAKDLNELERLKQTAKQDNDEDAYKYAEQNIAKIIKENRAQVTPQQWDLMSIDEKKSFIQTKMREAKVLNDEDDYNYWSANLKNLNEKEQTTITEYHAPLYNSAPKTDVEPSEPIQEVEEKKDYNYYFDEMMKAVKKCNTSDGLTEEQKKQLVGEVFYNEGYLIETLNNDNDIRQIMNRSVSELGGNDFQDRLQNIILSEMQDKYTKLHPETKNEDKNIVQSNNNDLDLSVLITQLRNKFSKIQNAYQTMKSDGYIDDEELATLIEMNEVVIKDGHSLRELATNPSDIETISAIVSNIEQLQDKMTTMQKGVEEINSGFNL